MAVVFWAVVATVVYAYVGYPVLTAVTGALLRRDVRRKPTFPTMTVVIAAYDEAEGIEAKIRNVLASTDPPSRLDIVIASDGSTDDTVERARAVGSPRVKVLELPRRGKASALAEAVRHARGDLLTFTDANTELQRGALAMLAFNFADRDVGGVAGNSTYRVGDDAESTDRGEDLYWRYDSWLKAMETRTGSTVSAHGGLYTVRRELFRPVEDAAVTDDYAISTAVVEQGKRLVFEERALAYEKPMGDGGAEFRRRVRLMTRGVRSVLLRRALLDPFRYGYYSVAFASRKLLRRLLPLSFPLLLVSSLALADQGLVYAGAAAAQLVLLALAGIGWSLRCTPAGCSPALYVPLYFCMANLASLVSLWNVARGSRIERWTPQRHATATSDAQAS
ncbi:MAG TPA: glycosyltransferase family 2 protein [Longimicrobiales bacterium]|nr:glycosyltransferase family 2 protein [Longimicrobiales bacterium]